jgi:hypothetical protein
MTMPHIGPCGVVRHHSQPAGWWAEMKTEMEQENSIAVLARTLQDGFQRASDHSSEREKNSWITWTLTSIFTLKSRITFGPSLLTCHKERKGIYIYILKTVVLRSRPAWFQGAFKFFIQLVILVIDNHFNGLHQAAELNILPALRAIHERRQAGTGNFWRI